MNSREIQHRLHAATVKAIEQVAEHHLRTPAREEAPKGAAPEDPHPGELSDEQHSRVEIHQDGDVVWAEVIFDTPYAKKQHENLHLQHPHGGKGHYLEDPLKALAARFERELGLAIREHLHF